MKKRLYFFILILFLLFSCTSEPDLEDNNQSIVDGTGKSITNLVSDIEGNIALASLQSDLQTSSTTRSFYDTYVLTSQIGADFIPIIFSMDNDRLVALSVNYAVSFDSFIICDIEGIIYFPSEINPYDIGNYIIETHINCPIEEKYFSDRILINTETKKVVSVKNIMSTNSNLGYDENYIYLPSDGRIAKINRDNMNQAIYITSNLENIAISIVSGDYVIATNDKAYLKDDSAKASIVNFRQPSDLATYLIPDDAEHNKYIFEVCYYYSGNRIYQIHRISTEKGSIGEILGSQKFAEMSQYPDIKWFTIDVPGILRPYMQTVRYAGAYYNQFVENDIGKTGNVLYSVDDGICAYFIEDSASESGVKCVVNNVDYSILETVRDSLYLYEDNEYLYFLDIDGNIILINLLTGEYEKSVYAINLEETSKEWFSISGTSMLYKEMVTGSQYVTKRFDITDLYSEPIIVDYETSDIVAVPTFHLK